VDASENVYAAGYSFRNGSDNDYLTIKYSASGEVLWVRRYNGPGYNDDQAQSLMLDGSGNVYVTGWSIAAGIGVNYDYAAVKYDSSGTQEWVARYDGPGGYDYAYSAALDSSGNVYVTGMSVDLVTNYDYATVKFNSSGIQQWVMRYSGQGFYWDEAHSVAVDGSGNVFVTGNVYNGSSLNDYTTIKYSQFVGITPVSNETPSEFRLYQNYPNPFNPTTLIKFDVAQFPLNKGGERGLFAELKIYDVLGGEIATIVNKQLNPGTYEIEWDGTNFPSGVYYYRLTAAEFTETRRMVLAK
jgi:hypothetical protein